jgi:hypothetical protein
MSERMKGAPVLHWPKLFEGWMLTGEYRNHGDGDKSGDGQGGGYITGQIIAKGNGYGGGIGDRCGGGWGGDNRCGDGGGAYAYSDGNGWSRRSV